VLPGMSTRVSIKTLAAAATTILAVGMVIAALAVPAPGGAGPTGRDCRLMAQALAERQSAVSVVASDQTCDWRRLGFPRARDINTLPEYNGSNFVGFESVDELRYSRWGTQAEVVVGSQIAELAGQGERCSYQRVFGSWHRSGCEIAWLS
jgi:hypothetical protein